MKYLGHLPHTDPLYGYLRYDILPLLTGGDNEPAFRVFRMESSNKVYLYEDENSHRRIIGKFFGAVEGRSADNSYHRMNREFDNLNYLRDVLSNSPYHYVPRPLGRNASLNCLLVVEYCWGVPLINYILGEIRDGKHDPLFRKLTSIGYFLASLHNRTAVDTTVNFDEDGSYYDNIIHQLSSYGHIGWEEADYFRRLRDKWHMKGIMWQDRRVTVHGDATPSNILLGDGLWVVAIDLERMKQADRVFDLGRVAGEMQHFFMLHRGNKYLAEPFIGHFIWEYCCHFPDRDSAFASITRRLPFYMGINLLRISRNNWINPDYRRQLLAEAKNTLRAGLWL